MSSPYVGEIRMFGGNFAPVGWMFCDGQLLPISEYETLFNLIGTTYGGDGQSTFALPNLQSRVPMHAGTNAGISFQLGEMAGVETVTLTVNQIPTHSHLPAAVAAPGTNNAQAAPANNVFADEFLPAPPNPNVFAYAPAGGAQVSFASNAIGPSGGSQPHDNMIPFLCVNFIISLFGIFPTQN
jgi:microcystin-dependent protein